jgi:methionyl-tRNA formyltransferase
MDLCIAGKNNIAVDCLYHAIKIFDRSDICVVLNQTDTKKNTWQKSLGYHAAIENISITTLEEVQQFKDIIFLSLEFDKIIRPSLFNTKKLFNIHFSLLPAYKGMYTSFFPILQGEQYSGVTLHEIDAGIDTGDIIDQVSFKMIDYTSRELYSKYLQEGTKLVCKYVNRFKSSDFRTKPQNKQYSTYYSKSALDFSKSHINPFQTAFQISQFVKALNFRVYQLANFGKHGICSTTILSVRTKKTPGSVLYEDIEKIIISTIDYDLELYKDYFSELMVACQNNDNSIVGEIVEFIKDVNETNIRGWTPLIVACYNGALDIVSLLISHGADINKSNMNGTTPLMYAKDYALKSGNLDIINILLSNGASSSMKDIYGKTVIDYT